MSDVTTPPKAPDPTAKIPPPPPPQPDPKLITYIEKSQRPSTSRAR